MFAGLKFCHHTSKSTKLSIKVAFQNIWSKDIGNAEQTRLGIFQRDIEKPVKYYEAFLRINLTAFN